MRRSIALLLVVALVLALAVPGVALGTVSISQKALTTYPYQRGEHPLVSGGRVAFDSVVNPDPTDAYRRVDVWDIASDTSLWSHVYAEVDLDDFEGDWVAYRVGLMGEQVYLYNLVTKQQWTVSSTIDVLARSVRISGNTAVWLEGDAPASILKTMNLTTGEVGTEGLVPSTDIAFEGNKVVYSRAFMADTNLWVYDLDTDISTAFVFENGPQVLPDIRNGLVVWLDGRNGTAVYSKPIAGGAEALVSDDLVFDQTRPRIGDKFVTWTRIASLEQGQDVWAHDLATGINFPVATGNGDQVSPATDGGRIAHNEWSLTSAKIMVDDVTITSPKITKLAAAKTVRVGAEAKFTLTVSNPDGADVQAIKWDWGDGETRTSQLTGGGKAKMSHIYLTPGQHTAVVAVTDSSGITVTTQTLVTVK